MILWKRVNMKKMDALHKFIDFDEFLKLREKIKSDNKILVMTNGCFDLLHVGHMRSLFDAKSHGDYLLVALNSDRAVRELKGEGKPLTPEMERVELMAAIECVDYVVIFDSNDAKKLILTIKPDVHAKGTDYTVENVPERKEVLSYGGKIAIVGDAKDHSTTEIIEKMNS